MEAHATSAPAYIVAFGRRHEQRSQLRPRQGDRVRGERVVAGGLRVDPELYEFVSTQVLPGLDLAEETVWDGLGALVAQAAPRIAEALATRERLQTQIDEW